MYYGIFLITLLITLLAQTLVSSTYNKYLKKRNSSGLTGLEVARRILDKNGLNDVKVTMASGILSDHYNPNTKTVNLSQAVYQGDSITALAVASHECGHAIQDKNGYSFLRIRSFLVPLVNFSSSAGYFAILIGIFASIFELIMIGIFLECVILAFELITLPVEFNASKRALEQLEQGFLTNSENADARKVLRAAAFTYVAAAANSALQILRLFLMFGNRRDE
ncbi:MAG: zinc metallopeptidase [Bacilli bacterium]|nr:zinc metallopeptidase [Bacilli bacterium]